MFFLGGIFFIGACSAPSVPQNEFLIEGELTNVPDSTILEFRVAEGDLLKEVGRDTVINGKFSFRDTIGEEIRQLLLMSDSKGFPSFWQEVWVAPGKYVRITGNDRLLQTWEVQSDIPEQAEVRRFFEAMCPEQIELLKYSVEEAKIFSALFREHGGDEAYMEIAFAQVDSLRKLEKPLEDIVERKKFEVLKSAPVTRVWLDKYSSEASRLQWDKDCPYLADIRALYSRMSEADKQTIEGQTITEYMNLGKEVNVGEEMVDGNLYDLDGNLHHLAELRGKYILLDFWSTGCGPCIQAIPEMEEIAEMYKDKLSVVSINEDSKASWQKFVREKKMSGIQWNELRRGRTGLAAQYKVVGIPHYVLISPEGKITDMWSGYGPGSLKSKLKKALKG